MQSTARNYSGSQKQAVREKIITPGRLYRSIILLAGEKCRTIEFLLKQGNINENTVITVIERDSFVMSKIKNRFKRYPFKKVNLSNTKVEDTPDYGLYDFMDLDTCSTISPKILNWIAQQRFLPYADVAMWFTAYRSSQKFKDYLSNIFFHTKAGIRVIEDMKDNSTDVRYVYDPIQLVSSAAIYTAINRYSCSVEPVLSYSEHVNSMYVYRFMNLNILPMVRPSLNDILVPVSQITSSQQVWKKDDGQRKLAGKPLMTMILKALDGSSGEKAYATRQLRIEIRSGEIAGKDPKWIRAGYKSYLSKIIENQELKNRAHQFIDKL